MCEPKAQYPRGTTFASRIEENKSEKKIVAEYVINTFLGPGQSAFISDGSSTFYIGLSLFKAKREAFRLYTNNLAIAHEFPLWTENDWPKDFTIELAGGKVNTELMMTGEPTCEEMVEQMTDRTQYAVLSLRALFEVQGPAGREPDSLGIKHAALKNSKRVILIADHNKFGKNWEPTIPLVFACSDEWQKFMQRETTYVITTLPPFKISNEMTELGRRFTPQYREEPKTTEEWYGRNTWSLRKILHRRFVELPCK